MSRTVRRKNYENEQGQNSWRMKRIAGYYTQVEYVWCEDDEYYWYEVVYREPTDAEYYHDYYRLHGESKHANAWSPSWWYRHNRMSQNRMHNKTELAKWIKNTDYEPVFENNPRSHYWDWC